MRPDITVLMSVYNNEATVGRAIQSILSQSYPHFSFIIVNDGSTDETLREIRKLNDKRIIIVNKTSNLGLTKRLNEQLSKINTPFMARMDADDESRINRFQIQRQYLLTNPDYAAVGSNSLLTYSKIKSSILIKNPFLHSSLFFRVRFLQEIGGYDVRFRYSQDYDLMLRLTARYPVANLKENLLVSRHSPTAVSQKHRFEQARFATIAQLEALLRGDYPIWQSIYLLRSLCYLFKSWLN